MMMKKMLFFVNPAAGKEEMRFQLMDDDRLLYCKRL